MHSYFIDQHYIQIQSFLRNLFFELSFCFCFRFLIFDYFCNFVCLLHLCSHCLCLCPRCTGCYQDCSAFKSLQELISISYKLCFWCLECFSVSFSNFWYFGIFSFSNRDGAAVRASTVQGVLAIATTSLTVWGIFTRKRDEKNDWTIVSLHIFTTWILERVDVKHLKGLWGAFMHKYNVQDMMERPVFSQLQ